MHFLWKRFYLQNRFFAKIRGKDIGILAIIRYIFIKEKNLPIYPDFVAFIANVKNNNNLTQLLATIIQCVKAGALLW